MVTSCSNSSNINHVDSDGETTTYLDRIGDYLHSVSETNSYLSYIRAPVKKISVVVSIPKVIQHSFTTIRLLSFPDVLLSIGQMAYLTKNRAKKKLSDFQFIRLFSEELLSCSASLKYVVEATTHLGVTQKVHLNCLQQAVQLLGITKIPALIDDVKELQALSRFSEDCNKEEIYKVLMLSEKVCLEKIADKSHFIEDRLAKLILFKKVEIALKTVQISVAIFSVCHFSPTLIAVQKCEAVSTKLVKQVRKMVILHDPFESRSNRFIRLLYPACKSLYQGVSNGLG